MTEPVSPSLPLAVAAAAEALEPADDRLSSLELARIAVDAAAPHIAAAVRERCAQLAEKVDAFYDAPCPDGEGGCVHQDSPFAALIREQP